jgi:diguanylate cyclase (GGDEF)-like protein
VREAVDRRNAATTAMEGGLDRLNTTMDGLHGAIAELVDRNEAAMERIEDGESDVVEHDAITADDAALVKGRFYPAIQGAGRLLRELDRINGQVQLTVAKDVRQHGPVAPFEPAPMFGAVDAVVSALSATPGDGRMQAAMGSVRHGVQSFKDLVRGMAADHAVFAAAAADIDANHRLLAAAQNGYLSLLAFVGRTIRAVEKDASAHAATDLGQAREGVIGIVLTTLLVGAAFSAAFAQRVTEPLSALTEQVRAIRTSGQLAPLPVAPATRRSDEVGTLSRVFNLMVAELAEARRHLIERSEAALALQYDRLRLAIESMPQGLAMFDAEDRLIICNQRFADMYQLPAELVAAGTTLRSILRFRKAHDCIGEAWPGQDANRVATLAQGLPWHFIDEMPNGKAMAITYRPLAGGGSVSTHDDITERLRSQAQIARMAHYDSLTDLPNRVSFRLEMERALAAERPNVAVLCLDLDQFKNVNDSLGHPVGDELLKAVAGRLRRCLGMNDRIARLGGDEFAMLQVGADQPLGSTDLARRLIEAVSEPLELSGHQVVISASVGISLAPKDGMEADRLLKNADMALYRAKANGRCSFRFFEPEMDTNMQARRALEIDLRRALSSQQFELHYQPLFNLTTDAITGCEALIRWRHPERGLVPPAEFVPLAEEIGLIGRIGAWAISQACQQAMLWPDHVCVAVNLSPLHFQTGALVLDVMSALGASGLPARRLELEITETMLLHDTETTLSILNQLRQLGVRISMDDFGTGYSSLGYLRRFPFDKVKIDRSFIQDLPQNRDSVAIVRAVAGLCRALGISTTAEGVETHEQLRRLKAEHCTEAQGFLLCRPQPAHVIEELYFRDDPTAAGSRAGKTAVAV